MSSSLGFFCFHEQATPEYYTDVHTLSLHCARPILHPSALWRPSRAPQEGKSGPHGGEPRDLRGLPSPAFRRRRHRPLSGRSESRSEEHTSELQSLMRNSYAVFCLKKKNNT